MATQIEMKPPPIKNKEANSVQITADQLLMDSQIHRVNTIRAPVQRVMDEEQLAVYKQQKRKQFEDKIRRQRYNLGAWVRYAQWQQSAKQFTRARSIFERALQIEYTNKSLWLRYAEMQMKHKFVNHARNIWERAIYYLPREDQFWFKYAYMEQLIGQYQKARQIFQRWMLWIPGEKAWMAFIKFQERMGETQNCKKIMYRYLETFPVLQTYLKVAKFEIKNKNRDAARSIYSRIITELGNQAMNEEYFSDFAKFQIKHRQHQRAREIFKFGLREIPKEKCKKLYNQYLNFQKQYGTKQEIDEVIMGERRGHYKELLSQNSLNYDAWINLISLEESIGNTAKTREVYEAAVKQVPPAQQKRFWRRYIYIWYNYAIFEQEIAKDMIKANQVFQRIIKLVPHKIFTFSKLWIHYAHFHLRCADIQKARKIFGTAIGKCPKEKIFKAYIQLQEQLCELERVRAIYQKYIQKFPLIARPWIQFANFEKNMEEFQRAKDILKIGHQMKVEGLPDPEKFIQEEE